MFRVMLQNRIPDLINRSCGGHYERFHSAPITNFYWGKDAILENPHNVQLSVLREVLHFLKAWSLEKKIWALVY